MNILHDTDLLDFVASQEAPQLRPATDYMREVQHRIEHGVKRFGDVLPWEKTHEHYQMRPGELTLWAGTNGNGKSLVLGQTMLWLVRETKVLIASFEMKPVATIERMFYQGSGGSQPGPAFYEAFNRHAHENLWIYDQTDTVEADRMLAVCHYAATNLGIKHIVIDSLMKLGLNEDDYNGQKTMIDKLCWVAKRYDIHIHLVLHTRKSANETDIPDKYSIKGTGAIVDLCDNLIIVHRNGLKEKQRRENHPKFDADAPDGFLRVAKQRHGESEKDLFAFWWHPDSKQWLPSNNGQVMKWL